MNEQKFLGWQQVLDIHIRQLELFGGQAGLRDPHALESALAQPEAAFAGRMLHSFPFEMAAAYAFHIAENQPFIDGNKRAALACALTFLDLNGIVVEDPDMKIYKALIEISAHRMTKNQFAELLETLTQNREEPH